MKKYLRKKGIRQLMNCRKSRTKNELHSLENDSKVQLAKEWFMVCKTKNNMQMLYLWKGTEAGI